MVPQTTVSNHVEPLLYLGDPLAVPLRILVGGHAVISVVGLDVVVANPSISNNAVTHRAVELIVPLDHQP
jgi:hypothetical protein